MNWTRGGEPRQEVTLVFQILWRKQVWASVGAGMPEKRDGFTSISHNFTILSLGLTSFQSVRLSFLTAFSLFPCGYFAITSVHWALLNYAWTHFASKAALLPPSSFSITVVSVFPTTKAEAWKASPTPTLLCLWCLLTNAKPAFLFLLFFYFGCAGSSLWCGALCCGMLSFCSCSVRASLGVAWGLEHTSSVVVALGLSCFAACGMLVPQPGIEPESPALECRFLTSGPPGKSQPACFSSFLPIFSFPPRFTTAEPCLDCSILE